MPGTIIKRYKRFLADVELGDGTVTVAHCTNTGTMATCWAPGDLVLLETALNPARKLPYTWLACRRDGAWVGVDTGMPNRVVAEAARRDLLPGLPGLGEVRVEQRYGEEGSRIDVLARDRDGRCVYIEVKNTTLRVADGACFPDAVTLRGAKHLRELRAMIDPSPVCHNREFALRIHHIIFVPNGNTFRPHGLTAFGIIFHRFRYYLAIDTAQCFPFH